MKLARLLLLTLSVLTASAAFGETWICECPGNPRKPPRSCVGSLEYCSGFCAGYCLPESS